jgi:hypothetical protein
MQEVSYKILGIMVICLLLPHLKEKKMTLKYLTAATLLLAGAGTLALIPKSLSADPTNGRQFKTTYVAQGTDDVYHIKYNGNEEGDVHVVATDEEDDTFLEIKVYDPDGNLIARDFGSDGHSPQCSFNVDSRWQWRQYTIKIVNFSNHDIPYTGDFY